MCPVQKKKKQDNKQDFIFEEKNGTIWKKFNFESFSLLFLLSWKEPRAKILIIFDAFLGEKQ